MGFINIVCSTCGADLEIRPDVITLEEITIKVVLCQDCIDKALKEAEERYANSLDKVHEVVAQTKQKLEDELRKYEKNG